MQNKQENKSHVM